MVNFAIVFAAVLGGGFLGIILGGVAVLKILGEDEAKDD